MIRAYSIMYRASLALGLLLLPWAAGAEIKPIIQVSGQLSISVDAEGNNNVGGGTIGVEKLSGTATVRAAYLMAASHGVFGDRLINHGDVLLAGVPVTWTRGEYNNAGSLPTFFHNVFADVTGIVKPLLDPLAAGIHQLAVQEIGTDSINGTILVVIFDDATQPFRSVMLLFGGQDTNGDRFTVQFAAPVPNDPNLVAKMGLGIAHAFQGTFGTAMVSLVDVNGSRLTSSAGGEDDGFPGDGSLITVGGIGDSMTNPPPLSPSFHFRTDDELYDLRPFLRVGDTSVVVDTVNFTDDDDILFAYFVTSFASAILPPVPAPGLRAIFGNLDPSKPTIVLTHGLQRQGEPLTNLWTWTGPSQATSLIQNSVGSNVNVVRFVWDEAFQIPPLALWPDRVDYERARAFADDAGVWLGNDLLRQLGANYQQPIHFIGHSLGSIVNTFAARTFLQSSNTSLAQFTALDRPDHVGKIAGITSLEESVLGFGAHFFAANLTPVRPGLTLLIDNYFSLTGAGVGDEAEGPVYNHGELKDPANLESTPVSQRIFPNEGFNNDHTGVQQWYRWTVRPHNPVPDGVNVCSGNNFDPLNRPPGLDDSLNPCGQGWAWSIMKNPALFPAANGKPISLTTSTLPLNQVQSFGCNFQLALLIATVTCVESSSPFLTAQVTIPADAEFLSFDYQFNSAGDGDYAAVLLDNVAVWVLSAANAPVGQLRNTGARYVAGLRGNRTLTVALYGSNQPNFSFQAQNFSTASVTVLNPAPLISALSPPGVIVGSAPIQLTVNGSGFLQGATVLWNGSPRQTQFVSATQVIATIPASDLSTAAAVNVTVENPAPTVGPSAASAFSVMDFSLTAAPSSVSVRPGQSASYTLNVAPLVGSFTSAVSLACSGLPALTSCSFSPASVTPGANAAVATLTISTVAPSVLIPPPTALRWPQVPVVFYVLFALLAACFAENRTRWNQRFRFAALLLMVAACAVQAGCGGGSASPAPMPRPGTAPGTYSVTVAGSSSGLQHSTTVTLVVQ